MAGARTGGVDYRKRRCYIPRFALYRGVAPRAPNLVPFELVEFLTEAVCFFWYHVQTLL